MRPTERLGHFVSRGSLKLKHTLRRCYSVPSVTLNFRVQELCESRGGCPELPVPNNPYDLCGHKATLNMNYEFANLKLKHTDT